MAKKRIHRIPHEEVKAVLAKHGVVSVNQAIEWGLTAGNNYPLISAKSIEGIVRGKRVLGVEFDRVDQILCALDSPEHWYTDLAQWYYPPNVVHEPEYETFLAQQSAFDRACELLEGVDAAISFG